MLFRSVVVWLFGSGKEIPPPYYGVVELVRCLFVVLFSTSGRCFTLLP